MHACMMHDLSHITVDCSAFADLWLVELAQNYVIIFFKNTYTKQQAGSGGGASGDRSRSQVYVTPSPP
jgi:hypothetical protein